MAFLWLPSENGERKKTGASSENVVARENSASQPDVPYRSRLYFTSPSARRLSTNSIRAHTHFS